MKILEYISLFGGVAGVMLSIIAVVVIMILKNNIYDIMVGNALFYEKNYEMKKTAIENSFNTVDYLVEYGVTILENKNFVTKAKAAYNDLICMVNDGKVADEFFRLCLNKTRTNVSSEDMAKYKSMCRKELGLKSPVKSYLGLVHKIEETKEVEATVKPKLTKKTIDTDLDDQA